MHAKLCCESLLYTGRQTGSTKRKRNMGSALLVPEICHNTGMHHAFSIANHYSEQALVLGCGRTEDLPRWVCSSHDCHVTDVPRWVCSSHDCHVTDIPRWVCSSQDCHVTDIPRWVCSSHDCHVTGPRTYQVQYKDKTSSPGKCAKEKAEGAL